MKDFIDKYLRTAPRDGSDAGGGDGGGGGGGQGGSNAGQPYIPEGLSDDMRGANDRETIDRLFGAVKGFQAPEPYVPEGLPDDWKGKDHKETIDKLFGVAKGYRDRDASKDVPEKPEGYLTAEGIDEKAFKLDDKFKPHFDFFAKDPGMVAAAKVAKEAGVSRPVFLKAMQEAMGALSEAGMLEPMVDEVAERAALLPDTHKTLPKDQQDAAIEARMTANEDFIKLMVANRGLDKDVAEYVQLMTFDSAKGHQFYEWLRGQIQGGSSGPGAHGNGNGGGADTAEGLKAEMQLPRNTPGHPEYDAKSYAEFDARYKKFHGATA